MKTATHIKVDLSKFNSLIAIADHFTSDAVCKQVVAQERWHGSVVCPYCGSSHCYSCRDGRYSCSHCKAKFSCLVGTIFENTKLPLRKWFMAMYLVSSHKKGISSLQLARDISVTQKTAWFMLQKIRTLYSQCDAQVLDGDVEMDEMYLGGRERNKHNSKHVDGTQGRSTKTKTPIFGMMEREGNVVALKVEDTKGSMLMPVVCQYVADTARIYTDEYAGYSSLGKSYYHQTVNHKEREFVRAGDIHTNSIEGFWAHFKRVVFSTYHVVSKDYLQRYIDEQVYRWNTRQESASYRFKDMLSRGCKPCAYSDVLSLSSVVNNKERKAKKEVRRMRHPAQVA